MKHQEEVKISKLELWYVLPHCEMAPSYWLPRLAVTTVLFPLVSEQHLNIASLLATLNEILISILKKYLESFFLNLSN